MFNLFKYELKKSLGLKIVLLCITAILEIFFLIGLYGEFENMLATSTMFLTLIAFIATILIGVHSIRLLRSDLNTKQAYMLFMTPNNSYRILGAKVIENGVSIIIAGLFYILLGSLDITLVFAKYDSLNELLDVVKTLLSFYDLDVVDAAIIISVIVEQIAHWLYIISIAFFAIVLSATFFNGRKWNGFASFGIFLAIIIVVNLIVGATLTPSMYHIEYSFFYVQAAIYLVLSVVMYFITAWIMDNKLSV